MTTIQIDRAVVEQALEALEQSETTVPYEGFGMARREAERKHQAAITNLRAALAQQAEPVEPVAWMFESERNFNLVGYGGWEKRITERRPNALQSSVRNVTALYTAPPQQVARQDEPLNLSDPAVQKRLATQWGYVPAAQAEPDLSRCPQCNGPADNGFDRSFPPSPYLCTKCMAEPVTTEDDEPVLVVEKEPDYWSGGHFYQGSKPHIDPTKVWSLPIGTKLYTAPPQRKLVPLTEAEIEHIGITHQSLRQVVRAVERAHGIKE